ncbi:hypothetical protein BDQ17DRAFT_1370345, partial [Cyathus striatus]
TQHGKLTTYRLLTNSNFPRDSGWAWCWKEVIRVLGCHLVAGVLGTATLQFWYPTSFFGSIDEYIVLLVANLSKMLQALVVVGGGGGVDLV